MNILGLLNLWLGKALASRGLGSSGGGPSPALRFACPHVATTMIDNTRIESAPIDNLNLGSTPIDNTRVESEVSC